MAKWADYGISAVRYNLAHTHIDRVRVQKYDGDAFGVSSEMTRAQVVAAIKSGTTFVTIVRGNDQKWQKGQPVRIIVVHGTEYIKTVDNGRAADNLENLPEF